MTVTLNKAREHVSAQTNLGGGYNKNSAKLILAGMHREHGREAVDRLIADYDVEQIFGFKPGGHFSAH